MTKPTDSNDTTRAVPKRKRCAIYARYSSDKQRESSIEDQVRKCREYAAKQGWDVLEEYVRFDQAVSGTSLAGRDGINDLLAAAGQRPRPFDFLLIDDTSRLARNLVHGLTIVRKLAFAGIHVVSVSQGVNSGDKSGSQLFTLFGLMDEQYIHGHADKVRRGQEGCVLKGCIPGGRCYGYRNVPIEDPNRKGDYGRPFVTEVRREIIPEEAAIVRHIFEMYARGLSFDKIAHELRSRRVLAPNPPRKDSIRAWSTEGISAMLRNEKYIGLHFWKRTTSVRDEAGHVATRPTPQEEWVFYEVPDWRIISDDLWSKVQELRAQKNRLGIQKLGGLERTRRSQKYLFSGLLFCGNCSKPISVVDGTAGGEIVRYGCGMHRSKAACSNSTTIRRDRLEEQLLAWLTRDLPQSDRVEQAAQSFHALVQKQVSELQAEARKNAINAPELRTELGQKMQEASKMTDFIVENGRQCWPTVQTRLAATEARIREIEELLACAREPDASVTVSADEIKENLITKLRDVQAVLTSEPQIGKQILRQHIRKITLTPGELQGKRVFHVAVEFNLGHCGNSDVMLTGTLDAFSQQYAFSTITVTGLALDTSRVRRKRTSLPNESEDSNEEVPTAPVNVSEIQLPALGSSPETPADVA